MALTGLTQLQPNNIQVVGIATFDQSVGIAGTLTYQDVTNVDAVGIVTARNGIDCDGDIDVDGHTNLDNVSIAGVTTMTGELKIDTTANNRGVSIEATGSNYTSLTGNAARTGADEFLLNIRGLWNDQIVSNIILETGSDTTNKDDGIITFRTASAGSPAERLRIQANGDISFSDSSTGSAQIKNVNGNQNSVNGGGSPQYAFVGNEGTGMRRASSNVLCFDTTGDERIRIASNGNIFVNNGNANANATLILSKSASGFAKLEFDEVTSQKAYIELDASEDLVHYGASGVNQIFYTGGVEVARFTTSNNLLLSQSAVEDWDGSRSHRLQITGDSSNTAGMSILATQNDDNPCEIVLGKSRSTGNTIIQNGDDIGQVRFSANDGNGFHSCAYMRASISNTPGNNDLPTKLRFGTASDGGVTVLDRMTINPDRVELNNNTYLSIPHDEICITFDEGQKMITSNDGQGNFNFICGKNNIAQHVGSSSGNSGISQIELSGDGTDGGIYFAVGPTRSAGSSALFTNGFHLLEYTSSSANYLNGLVYATGSSTSPGGLSTQYPVIHSGNAATGSWNTSAGAIFKCLGDGGSIALTTNDGGGNCNVTFNHANETSDTTGSCWRIRADIDSANSHFYIQNNTSVSSGQSNISMTNRLEISESGTFYGSSSNNISDVRLKKNIATITDATAKIKGLKGRTFEWKEEAELDAGTQYGFIAQEMETVISDLVSDGTKAGLRSWDKDGNLLTGSYSEKDKIAEYSKGVNVDGVVPILVEALKEAITRIETLETKVAALEGS